MFEIFDKKFPWKKKSLIYAINMLMKENSACLHFKAVRVIEIFYQYIVLTRFIISQKIKSSC